MRRVERCNLCLGQSFSHLFVDVIEKSSPWSEFISAKEFPITVGAVLCRSCGWIFQNPLYDEEELGKLYGNRDADPSIQATCSDEGNAIRGRHIYRTLEPWLPAIRGRVLDVGGRDGELMGTFVDYGYEVTVIDVAGRHPAFPAIVKIWSPFMHWHNGKFSVVIMSHVLEHTDNPSGFLEHARKLLIEGGVLFVEVPSELITPLIRRHVGDHRHLGYFSRCTLRAFLEKSGFSCLQCKLVVDLVGAPIPVIRAVAKKMDGNESWEWKPRSLMALNTVAEAFNCAVWMPRMKNRILQYLGRELQ